MKATHLKLNPWKLTGQHAAGPALAGSIAGLCIAFFPALCPAAEQKPASQPPPKPSTEDSRNLSLEDLMNVKVARVTTASKLDEKATSAPGMAIVIDKNDIPLRGYSTLKDVLRDLPGMETIEFSNPEFGTQVPVRGIVGNNKIVVLVNGMRVNPPGGENFPVRTDFGVRNAEQIEVVYGPGSTLYGRDAASAVINIKTKQPLTGTHADAGLGWGLHNEREAYGSFESVLNTPVPIRLSGYVQYHDSELTRLDKKYPAWWRDYQTIAAPKGSGTVPYRQDYGLNAFVRLEVSDFTLQAWYRGARRNSAEGYGPILAYLPEAIWEDRQAVVEAKYSTKLSDKVRFDSAVTFNWYEVDPSTRFVFPANNTQWFFNDFKYSVGYSVSIEESLRVDVTKNISLLAGVNYAYYDIVPKSTVPGGANASDSIAQIQRQGGNFTYYTTPNDPSSIHLIPRVTHSTYDVYGAYVEAGWQATPKLKLLLGGRMDKDSRIHQPSYTPRGAVIWNVTDEFTAKYSYTTAYLSPAPYFGFATYDSGTQLATSNTGLQPENTVVHELDFNYTKKDVQLGLALYHGEQQNLIIISDRAASQNIIQNPVFVDLAGTMPRKLAHTANGGSSVTNGLDFYGRLRWGNVTPWFSYSYVDYHSASNGMDNGLLGISHHNGRVGLTWAATPRLFITPSLVIRSTPDNVAPGNLARELRTPYEVNLNVLWQATDKMEFYANIRNLTDNHYALGGTVGQAIPQESINGMLGFRIKF